MIRELIIVAGPNGSGKTTFAKEYLRNHKNYVYINPDEIAKKINPKNISAVALSAGRKYIRQIQTSLKKVKNVIIESTLSGLHIGKWIEEFRKKKYDIVIIYIFLDSPKACIERIKERVRQGGHYVPDEDVTRRYGRSKRNFWSTYKNVADRWHLYFSGFTDNVEVATGEKQKYEIKNEELFNLFIKQIERK